MGAAAAKGKGKGKGFPAPPPPTAAAKGAGVKGAGVKGAGKGKGPPLRAANLPSTVSAVIPPPELTAPEGATRLVLRATVPNAEGTIWQGLNLWDANGKNVLLGAAVDLEAIRRLWSPMPEPPMPVQVGPRRAHLPDKMQQSVEIAVRAKGLSAELVRRGLMQDALALDPEQAEVLHSAVVPVVREAEPHLLMVVNRQGVTALNNAEQVLWALSSVPLMEVRARLVREQHLVEEEVAHVQRCVDAVSGVAAMLTESAPVRTVFQMLLVVRNILVQRGHEGYVVTTFDGLPMERVGRHAPTVLDPATGLPVPVDHRWLQEQNPSVLRLVAEMLESTHERRCRLRFLRLLAVGRLLSVDSLCQRVWAFLDDLRDSPRDALTHLEECSPGLCPRDVVEEISEQALKFRQLQTRDLVFLRDHASYAIEGHWEQQIEAAALKFADGLQVCDEGCRSVSHTAVRLCCLGGEKPCALGSAESFNSAGAVLRSMRCLGTRLREEMSRVRSQRRERAMASMAVLAENQSRQVRRHWALVDTSGHELLATSDPDRIRQLRWRPMLETEEPTSAEEPQAPQPKAAECKAEAQAPVRNITDMVHGGVEGVYRRDPMTGKWGRRLDGLDGTSLVELNLGGPSPDL